MTKATGPTITEALDEFELHLRVRNVSPATVRVYGTTVRQLAAFIGDKPVATLSKNDVSSYLHDVLDHWTASTAVTRWGGLLAFCKWAKAERLVRTDPMASIQKPQQEERVVPVLAEADVRALLGSCAGSEFKDMRDAAIFRMLMTTGRRRSELAGLRVDDVDLRAMTITVMGKGRRERTVHPGGHDRAGAAPLPACPAAPGGRLEA